MDKHTPGPWFVGNAPSHSAKAYARRPGDNVRLVANCEQHEWIERSAAENRANARLIAAAPELLEACRECLAALRDYREWRGIKEPEIECAALIRQLEAAIVKADAKE